MGSRGRVNRRGRLSLLVGALFSFVALASVAYADDITNNVDASTDAEAEIMPLTQDGASATTRFAVVPQNGDGKSGCNLTGRTTLGLSVGSSDTAVATVSPTSLTFTSCGDEKTVTVTPHGVGSATISLAQTSNTTGGTFNLAPATFTVNVSPPPNTPPLISVAGVTVGASYAKGAVPTASCDVTDTEDGNSSFAATLSAVSGPHAGDGIGQQTASCSYTDAGGITAAASVTYGIVDPSAPSIAGNVTGTVGNNEWYTSNVSLAWLVSDSESPSSLVKTGCVDQNITSDQGATSYTCAATSAGGSAGPISVVIKRDATAPTISGSSTFAPNANGWSNTNVVVSYTCTDALSELASCSSPETVSGEGDALSATGTAIDNAGNSATATVGAIKIDKTAPTIAGSSSPEANAEGWNKTDVVVSFSCDDTLSGVASCAPDQTLSSEGSALSATGTALDKAGNSGTTTVSGIKIDKTPPTISGSRLPAANANGWNNTDVTVTFNCGDSLSGVAFCSPSETFTAEGADFSAAGTALDRADNSAATTVGGIKIDKTAPVVSATANKSPIDVDGTAWYKDGVAFTWTATDGGSGIATGPTPSTSTFATTGTGLSGSSQATDRADNTGTGGVNGINVDANAPTAQFSGCLTSPLILGSAALTLTWTANDQGSGLTTPANGSVELTTSSVGTKTASSPAPQDNVGHTGAPAQCTYNVIYQWHGFFQPVDNNGIFNAVKAGQGIPLKFDLDGNQGLGILASGYPKSSTVSCSGATTEDALEETVTAGNSSLHYDPTVNPPVGQYIYVWKSDKSWAGTCRRLDLKLSDGTTHSANFAFKR